MRARERKESYLSTLINTAPVEQPCDVHCKVNTQRKISPAVTTKAVRSPFSVDIPKLFVVSDQPLNSFQLWLNDWNAINSKLPAIKYLWNNLNLLIQCSWDVLFYT